MTEARSIYLIKKINVETWHEPVTEIIGYCETEDDAERLVSTGTREPHAGRTNS